MLTGWNTFSAGVDAAAGFQTSNAENTTFVGQPTGGEGYEMQAVLAVVMGGTLITGGIGSASGAFFGALILALLDNILNLQGNVDSAVRNCIIGVIFLIVVILQQRLVQKRRRQYE